MCGVSVKIFASVVLSFCSNVFGSFTFVAKISFFFRATCSFRLSKFGSACCLIPLNLTFNFSFSRAIARLVFTPVIDGCGLSLAGVC